VISGKHWKIPYYLGLAKVPTAPLYLNVDPSAACNLRCGWCSSQQRSNGKALMDMTLFERIVDEAKAAGVVNISLWLAGEPLMNPRLPEMVAYVESRGLVSGIHTNATLLTEKRARELLDAGVKQMSISLDGDDPQSYEQRRRGASFDKTVANIRTFLQLKAQQGGRTPHTIIQTILPFRPEMQSNDGWIHYPDTPAKLRHLFDGLPVDEFRALLPHNWTGEISGEDLRPSGRAYHPCQHLWMGLSIAWDGRVHGCCADINGRMIRGDLRRGDTIRAIWNDATSQRMRRLHRRGRYREIELCKNCTEVWGNEHPLRSELRYVPLLRPFIAAKRLLLRQSRALM